MRTITIIMLVLLATPVFAGSKNQMVVHGQSGDKVVQFDAMSPEEEAYVQRAYHQDMRASAIRRANNPSTNTWGTSGSGSGEATGRRPTVTSAPSRPASPPKDGSLVVGQDGKPYISTGDGRVGIDPKTGKTRPVQY